MLHLMLCLLGDHHTFRRGRRDRRRQRRLRHATERERFESDFARAERGHDRRQSARRCHGSGVNASAAVREHAARESCKWRRKAERTRPVRTVALAARLVETSDGQLDLPELVDAN